MNLNPTKQRQIGILLTLILVPATLLGGCLDDASEPPENTSAPETAPDNTTPSAWQVNGTRTPTFPGSWTGVPFSQYGGAGEQPCEVSIEFQIPGNATRLTTHLYGSPTSPGTGYMIHRIAGPEQVHYPGPVTQTPQGRVYEGAPDTSYWINVTDPESGAWEVGVFPHGQTVEQVWTLDIVIEGTGQAESWDAYDATPTGSSC